MASRVQLDLPVLLPDVPDAQDACVERLTERLQRRDGVEHVHHAPAENGEPDRIRVEYDQTETEETAIREALQSMGVQVRGARLEAREGTAGARRNEGVLGHDRGGFFGANTELIFALLAGVCVAAGFGFSFVGGMSGWVPWSFYVGAYVFGGGYAVREAVDALAVGDFEVDLLMLAAAAGAAVLGKWLEGAFLLFLFSLGHSLEHYAMGRARRAIQSLAELAPDVALVRRNGEEREVPVEEVSVGDTVLVRPNERVPTDGIVAGGKSAVNQAPVTGESVPVDKAPVEDPEDALQDLGSLGASHQVFAGTINGRGALEIRVTKRADETMISQVVQMVTEAEADKSPTERFTDRFERAFVPAVLGLVGLLLVAGGLLDEPFADSFYRAMAVLVAASPCALAIATPSAVLSGVARAGQGGVLVKGGGPLEQLGRLGAVAFDKTGTLTKGTPHVTEVRPFEETSKEELLRLAVSVEQLSEHPLAEAIQRYGNDHLEGGAPDAASGLETIAGRGVKAAVGGVSVYIGNDSLFAEIEGAALPPPLQETVDELESAGRTTMIVRRGDEYLGVIGLMDAPRDGAREVVERLREIGVTRQILISGDNQQVVNAVADEVGIDEARGDLLPDDKVEAVRALREEEDVAMVGDGVNDAPALANATVGIAMGAAGSDTALETADVALMADELGHLPFAMGLSRQTRRIIKQNLWVALGMVAVLVPATILGLNIGPAVVLHEGSTLIVVANALRLLGYSA